MTPIRLTLGIARLLIGIGAWFAPDTTVRIFGISPDRNDRFITRLFGAREFTMAAALLAAPPAALPAVARVGAAIDGIDSVAGFHEAIRGNLSRQAVILGPVGALGFVAMGVVIDRQATSSR
ncbi:MAG: hypothetical protein ACOH2Q_22705 [Rhodococcus sp. (in: high G+C Gram-positive bacteria)]